jgi:23S rRNA pseudouridine2605 synthase
MTSPAPQRIAKLLARAGVASRREIERMIEEGRIAVNGETVDKPATLLTSLHGVTVDGKAVREAPPARLFRYHKPAGLLTTERDPKGRPTIYDRLPRDLPRLMPVGRLDLNTEGLLLLTTDGELKRTLELPATGVERSYRARVFGDVSQAQLEELIHGVEIEGIRYGAIDANLERRTGRNGWVEMRLREGKNREVRRVLEYLGLQISRLIRTAYGPFPLADLPPGAVDEVKQHELVAFRKALGSSLPGHGEERPVDALLRAAPTARPPAAGRRDPPGPTGPRRGASRHPDKPGERKADRVNATSERRPGRPNPAGERRTGRANAMADRNPGRPDAAGERRPGRLTPTGDRKPGRPSAGGDRKPGRPDAVRDRKPGRPGMASSRKPGRPNAAGDRKPGRPSPPRGGRK